jgi:large subunit ribosomal protein L18
MNKKLTTKREKRERRKLRVRSHLAGTAERPRLCVFRSLKSLTLQVIDDTKGVTLVGLTSKGVKSENGELSRKVSESFALGKEIAQKALALGIKKVVFDRAGYAYHGRVKAAAEGAREAGLEF